MQNEKSWEYITKLGKFIKTNWQHIPDTHSLDIKHNGLPSLSGFSFTSKSNLKYKTLITQEMLKEGFLAANSIYVSTAHSESILQPYFVMLDKIFSTINSCENGDLDIDKLLIGPTCHSGFRRLN